MSLIKLAGIWDGIGKGLLAAGKHAMGNKVIRNAAVGAGIGAIGGAMKGGEGNRISGAMKGGLLGGVVGGGATAGTNIYKNMKLNNIGFTSALKQEGTNLINTGKSTLKTFQINRAPIKTGVGESSFSKRNSTSTDISTTGKGGIIPTPKTPLDQKLSAEQMKHPSILNLPPSMRKTPISYYDAASHGVNIENLTSQNQNVQNMRALANEAMPVKYNSFNSNAINPIQKKRSFLSRIF